MKSSKMLVLFVLVATMLVAMPSFACTLFVPPNSAEAIRRRILKRCQVNGQQSNTNSYDPNHLQADECIKFLKLTYPDMDLSRANLMNART